MPRPLPPPGAKPRRRVFHAALARAASAGSSILSGSPTPGELRVCDQMRDVFRSLPGISIFPPQTLPNPAAVYRDCHAACGRVNPATALETGEGLEGAILSKGQRPSA